MWPSSARSEGEGRPKPRPLMAAAAPGENLWRWLAIGLALVAYAIASHLLMVYVPDRPWSVAVLFGPLWAVVTVAAWARRDGFMLTGCALVLAVIVVVVARGGVSDIHLMYVLQHAAIHVALAWSFGLTLREGEVPLITAMAERLHVVTPAMRAYTRALTRVWVGYFVGSIVFSVALYALAPWPWWSLYCNVLTPAAVIALFVGEHFWRRHAQPEFPRISLLSAIRAYRQTQPRDAAAARNPDGAAP
jgi:uncharacterized membrane protein